MHLWFNYYLVLHVCCGLVQGRASSSSLSSDTIKPLHYPEVIKSCIVMENSWNWYEIGIPEPYRFSNFRTASDVHSRRIRLYKSLVSNMLQCCKNGKYEAKHFWRLGIQVKRQTIIWNQHITHTPAGWSKDWAFGVKNNIFF